MRKTETADKLPPLDRGYRPFTNEGAGITLGRPPGWEAAARGTTTNLTAPDKLVAVTVTADRTNDALASNPRAFAAQTAELLTGYRKPLDPSRPKVFKHHYMGASVEASGVAKKSGVKERVEVIVLERTGVAVVTAVVAENAEQDADAEAKQALESIGTLRTQPPD